MLGFLERHSFLRRKSRQNKNNIWSSKTAYYEMSCARSTVSHECLTCQWGYWFLQCAVKPSSQSRQEGGHASPTSREQWAVFSWITVASSPLPSHWFAVPHHSSRQEAVTNRNAIFIQSGAPVLRWLIFKVTFFDEISVLIFWQKSVISSIHTHTHTHAHTHKKMSVWTMNWRLFMLSWVSNLNGTLLTY